jgi:protease-4
VDALGSAGYVAREIVGEEDIVDYTQRRGYLDQFARQLGTSIAERLMMWGALKLQTSS